MCGYLTRSHWSGRRIRYWQVVTELPESCTFPNLKAHSRYWALKTFPASAFRSMNIWMPASLDLWAMYTILLEQLIKSNPVKNSPNLSNRGFIVRIYTYRRALLHTSTHTHACVRYNVILADYNLRVPEAHRQLVKKHWFNGKKWKKKNLNQTTMVTCYRLCGLVIRFPGFRSRGPGSILGATRFPEK